MKGLNDATPLYVNAYPVAWRVETVNDDIHSGFEYVRFYWGPTKRTWDLAGGYKDDGTKVQFYDDTGCTWQMWRLIPLNSKTEGIFAPSQLPSETLGSGPLPSYDRDVTGQSASTHAQHMGSERDDFGTVVTEVTIVTTRKRYRVKDV
ncbi:hypothetical protein BDM02DRAFT_1746022 [Thelephora ganbajun]|uniref:Uncharacterized protein n=1 Tax=Thelephora ganbajun TaxID=370292 RepID=A0ACB6ZJH6_THEGA|nr:hypothetical protein BDM02DRAFT_1746022 [Thelephora ganbajun]